MKFITPVTDRTRQDILDHTAKAYFNVSDWKRIYENSLVLKALIEKVFGITIPFTVLTTPTTATLPTALEINTLIQNINNILMASNLPGTPNKANWLAGVSVSSPDYNDVNAWELLTALVMSLLALDIDYVIYCGVAATGQPRFYQHRWRQYGWIVPAGSPVRRARTGVAITGTSLTRQNQFRRYS